MLRHVSPKIAHLAIKKNFKIIRLFKVEKHQKNENNPDNEKQT